MRRKPLSDLLQFVVGLYSIYCLANNVRALIARCGSLWVISFASASCEGTCKWIVEYVLPPKACPGNTYLVYN